MDHGLTERQRALLLRPLTHTGRSFYIFFGILLVLIGWFLYVWYYQLRNGLGVTGMRGPVGAFWGLYIVNFIFFIGITHAGIAIAAAIRLFKLHDYVALARIAELVTILSLMAAGVCIILDMGRPDRIFNVILTYPWRVASSPLVWDITAVTTYLVFAVTYLYIEMRGDLAMLAGKIRWGWLYRRLLPAYNPGERKRVERIVFWASIFNFPIMVMVHTTVAWIFGLQVGRPEWYSAIKGPYYVFGAVLTGVATVVVMAAIYRRLFHWEEFIKPLVFRGLGRFLCWTSIFYLYFILSDFMTIKFAGPLPELKVMQAKTEGDFAFLYWFEVIALAIGFTVYIVNTLFHKVFRVWSTVAASALVVVALWVGRYIIVVPSLVNPFLPFPAGSYHPTWVEWSLTGGGFVIIALGFMVFTKVLPIIPFTEMESILGEKKE